MVSSHRYSRQATRTQIALALGVLALAGCGTDLGECDMNALGGGNVGGVLMPHTGQSIVGTTCSGGRCHSSNATGALRYGAPAELDFDVLLSVDTEADRARVLSAAANVVDNADEMWEEIDDGAMPPPPPAGPGELASADKESVRNWLACGAEPILAAPGAPTEATWQAIWPALSGKCVSCHNAASGPTIGMGFVLGDMTDACGSYMNIVSKSAVTPACSGSTIVVPGMPDQSLLIDKLSNTMPSCGAFMPLTDPMPLATTNPALVAAISQWIADGALPPPGCTPP